MINFNGNNYETRDINIAGPSEDEQEVVTVAKLELQSVLLDESFDAVNDEAEEIDNTIYFYLNEEEWELPDDELRDIINSNRL